MLKRACFIVVLTAAALSACGGDEPAEPAATQATTARGAAATHATTAPAPAATNVVAGQNELPEQPQVALDFGSAARAELMVDPAARARISGGALQLELTEPGTARAAPDEQPPDDVQTTLVIARVRAPQALGGRAGVFCRGDDDGNGYELTLDSAGRVRLDRVAGGRRTTLARGQARLDAAIPADSPIPLVLVCGRGDEASGPHVVFTVGAQQAAGVRDRAPLPAGSGSRSGMLVAGERGDSASFTVFTLTYGP